MNRLKFLTTVTACLLGLWIRPASAAEDVVRVALLGDSTVRTSYLPKPEQHHIVLQAMLHKAAPHRKFAVVNWADNGEFIPRYLIRGRYDRNRKTSAPPDIAILRFGINDQKYSSAEEFSAHVSALADLLIADFPRVAIMLETGPYVDYPTRYNYDRETVLKPYWQGVRDLAERRGFTLIDFHAVSEKATIEGNWDQRIRLTDRKTEPYVFDSQLDKERGHDVRWFSDIHPNQEGVRLAAEAEVSAILDWAKVRKASGPTGVRIEEPRDYSLLLNFQPERLDRSQPSGTPKDHLQKSLDPRK